MEDLRNSLSGRRSGLDLLLSKIPGYGGYRDKELRREADQKLRLYLADQFSQQLRRAEEVSQQMLTGPGLSQLAEMGQANTRLQTLIDRVKTASQGYTGFFDAVKIGDEELDRLYEFDENMLHTVDDIAAALEALQAALDAGETDKLAPVVRRYARAISDAATTFDRRKEILAGLGY
ncbi:MAG: hypothetical protein D6784_07265 [Chloroflexi bacterium]|nr:MAG: hypothetical protein D6784_07265 [Chloroflexota bacterium]